MKTKVFIDGSAGTTGLRIYERFEGRDDVEILTISNELRKDLNERKRLINCSDVTFLCLPDVASREVMATVENDHVKIFDTSTAHRTNDGWAYGFPELSKEHRSAIRTGNRIAVPGCHASGFISLVYPLISKQIMSPDYPVSSYSLTGYSGGGKKKIAEYKEADRSDAYYAPCEYALSQEHKHLKEMKIITGLKREPLFTPIISNYYSGMVVSVPLYADMLNGNQTLESVHQFFEKYYEGQMFVKVMPLGAEAKCNGLLAGNACSGWDGMKLFITGNKERLLLSSQFDNLGKGASGAAIQCLNLSLGCKEDKGLNL